MVLISRWPPKFTAGMSYSARRKETRGLQSGGVRRQVPGRRMENQAGQAGVQRRVDAASGKQVLLGRGPQLGQSIWSLVS